ncbi:metallopeptidase TldD-related protein [Caulobacter segnis]
MAAELARRSLGARSVESRRCPVLFEPRTAATLVGELAGALTGAAQYRRMSFLPDPIGRRVAASHLNLHEDPFEPLGLVSGGFDSEGRRIGACDPAGRRGRGAVPVQLFGAQAGSGFDRQCRWLLQSAPDQHR